MKHAVSILLFVLLMQSMNAGQSITIQRTANGETSRGSITDSARLAWMRGYATADPSGVDAVSAVAIDQSGSIYVTGKSETASGKDYLTVKYSPSGQELWRAVYDGAVHQDDIPNCLAIDNAGNVYVTGMSGGESVASHGVPFYDYATVKYNSSGEQQWVARYDAPSNYVDIAAAIALDYEGNVYVTGESETVDSGSTRIVKEFATIKYNSAGTQQWVKRFRNLESSDNRATSLAADDSGNVYVGGYSLTYAYPQYTCITDFITVKYDRTGSEQWICHTSTDSMYGQVTAIGIDAQRNVYFTGFVADLDSCGTGRIISSRVNANGESGWVRMYDDSSATVSRANSIAIDGTGTIVVAGIAARQFLNPLLNQGESVISIKYSANGTQLWTQKYQDETASRYKQSGLVIDNSGSVYIAATMGTVGSYPYEGKSSLLLKYGDSGGLLWSQQFARNGGTIASALAKDGQGNIIVGGSVGSLASRNFLTMKYLTSGNRAWDAQADGSGCSVEGVASMAVDAQGNVYVAGQEVRGGQDTDFLIIKSDARGNELWAARYDNGLNTNDYASKIVEDKRGNVYMTGSSTRNGYRSYVTMKYNALGGQVWVRSFANPNSSVLPNILTLDIAGNVFVGGTAGFVEYDSAGYQLQSTHEPVQAIAVDRWKNVYVAKQNALMKFDSTGSSSTFFSDYVDDIAIDDSGNVYLTALYGGIYVGTRKFSPSGQQLWVSIKGGEKLFFAAAGNIIVKTAYSYQHGEIASRLNNAGIVQNSYEYNSGEVRNMSVDATGNVYIVASESPSNFGNLYCKTIKFTPSGSTQWTASQTAQLGFSLVPNVIAVDGTGNAYVAAVAVRPDLSTGITVLKYENIVVSVKENEGETPSSFSLQQNYPNPFNPTTNIKFEIDGLGLVSLKVFDVLGRNVATLVNEPKSPGAYTVQWDANNVSSGTYYYRLQSQGQSQTKKMLLIR